MKEYDVEEQSYVHKDQELKEKNESMSELSDEVREDLIRRRKRAIELTITFVEHPSPSKSYSGISRKEKTMKKNKDEIYLLKKYLMVKLKDFVNEMVDMSWQKNCRLSN